MHSKPASLSAADRIRAAHLAEDRLYAGIRSGVELSAGFAASRALLPEPSGWRATAAAARCGRPRAIWSGGWRTGRQRETQAQGQCGSWVVLPHPPYSKSGRRKGGLAPEAVPRYRAPHEAVRLRFRPPGGADRPAPGVSEGFRAPAGRAWGGRRSRRSSRTRPAAPPETRRHSGRQRYPRAQALPCSDGAPPETGGPDVEIEVNLNSRVSPAEWSAFARPGKRLKEGDTIAFAGGLEARVRPSPTPKCSLPSIAPAPNSTPPSNAAGTMPLPPYIASKRAPDEKDAQRLSDDVRARDRLGRRSDRRTSFYARPARASLPQQASGARRSRSTSTPVHFCR